MQSEPCEQVDERPSGNQIDEVSKDQPTSFMQEPCFPPVKADTTVNTCPATCNMTSSYNAIYQGEKFYGEMQSIDVVPQGRRSDLPRDIGIAESDDSVDLNAGFKALFPSRVRSPRAPTPPPVLQIFEGDNVSLRNLQPSDAKEVCNEHGMVQNTDCNVRPITKEAATPSSASALENHIKDHSARPMPRFRALVKPMRLAKPDSVPAGAQLHSYPQLRKSGSSVGNGHSDQAKPLQSANASMLIAPCVASEVSTGATGLERSTSSRSGRLNQKALDGSHSGAAKSVGVSEGDGRSEQAEPLVSAIVHVPTLPCVKVENSTGYKAREQSLSSQHENVNKKDLEGPQSGDSKMQAVSALQSQGLSGQSNGSKEVKQWTNGKRPRSASTQLHSIRVNKRDGGKRSASRGIPWNGKGGKAKPGMVMDCHGRELSLSMDEKLMQASEGDEESDDEQAGRVDKRSRGPTMSRSRLSACIPHVERTQGNVGGLHPRLAKQKAYQVDYFESSDEGGEAEPLVKLESLVLAEKGRQGAKLTGKMKSSDPDSSVEVDAAANEDFGEEDERATGSQSCKGSWGGRGRGLGSKDKGKAHRLPLVPAKGENTIASKKLEKDGKKRGPVGVRVGVAKPGHGRPKVKRQRLLVDTEDAQHASDAGGAATAAAIGIAEEDETAAGHAEKAKSTAAVAEELCRPKRAAAITGRVKVQEALAVLSGKVDDMAPLPTSRVRSVTPEPDSEIAKGGTESDEEILSAKQARKRSASLSEGPSKVTKVVATKDEKKKKKRSLTEGPGGPRGGPGVRGASQDPVAARPRDESWKAEFQRQAQIPLDPPPWQTLWTENGKVWDGDMHWGAFTVKKKLFSGPIDDPGRQQITKSCHFCQYQHIMITCRNGQCVKSYCDRCMRSHFPTETRESMVVRCPRCRGFCNCKACLRQEFDLQLPTYSECQEALLQEHVLRHSGPYVAKLIAREDAEAAELGPSGVYAAKLQDMGKNRVVCDRCATSIPNLHRKCKNCGWELCLDCCADLRCTSKRANGSNTPVSLAFAAPSTSAAAAAASPVSPQLLPLRCRQCVERPVMHLERFFDDDMMRALRNVAQEYGKVKEQVPINWSSYACGVTTKSKSPPAQYNGKVRQIKVWGRSLPETDVRLACNRPELGQQYIFTPCSTDLVPGSSRFLECAPLFMERWAAGEPIVVRNVSPRMSWSPETMMRACRELGSLFYKTKGLEDRELQVLDCDGFKLESMTQQRFFTGYAKAGQPRMLKVKDWPPQQDFRVRLVRHNQDFMEMLPMPMMVLPRAAPLNMAASMPHFSNPTDLGPKTYVAYGQIKETLSEGDSVTKMHQDMSDAVNVLLHAHMDEDEKAQVRCGKMPADLECYGNAGAVWDLWRREDTPALRGYLKKHANEFIHHGKPVTHYVHEVFDQCFMLNSEHRKAMQAECGGVESWHFEQHVHEAVFIPAGCPHQVRNLRSCIKVAVDFVSPESSHEVLSMSEQLRQAHFVVEAAKQAEGNGTPRSTSAQKKAARVKSEIKTENMGAEREAERAEARSRVDSMRVDCATDGLKEPKAPYSQKAATETRMESKAETALAENAMHGDIGLKAQHVLQKQVVNDTRVGMNGTETIQSAKKVRPMSELMSLSHTQSGGLLQRQQLEVQVEMLLGNDKHDGLQQQQHQQQQPNQQLGLQVDMILDHHEIGGSLQQQQQQQYHHHHHKFHDDLMTEALELATESAGVGEADGKIVVLGSRNDEVAAMDLDMPKMACDREVTEDAGVALVQALDEESEGMNKVAGVSLGSVLGLTSCGPITADGEMGSEEFAIGGSALAAPAPVADNNIPSAGGTSRELDVSGSVLTAAAIDVPTAHTASKAVASATAGVSTPSELGTKEQDAEFGAKAGELGTLEGTATASTGEVLAPCNPGVEQPADEMRSGVEEGQTEVEEAVHVSNQALESESGTQEHTHCSAMPAKFSHEVTLEISPSSMGVNNVTCTNGGESELTDPTERPSGATGAASMPYEVPLASSPSTTNVGDIPGSSDAQIEKGVTPDMRIGHDAHVVGILCPVMAADGLPAEEHGRGLSPAEAAPEPPEVRTASGPSAMEVEEEDVPCTSGAETEGAVTNDKEPIGHDAPLLPNEFLVSPTNGPTALVKRCDSTSTQAAEMEANEGTSGHGEIDPLAVVTVNLHPDAAPSRPVRVPSNVSLPSLPETDPIQAGSPHARSISPFSLKQHALQMVTSPVHAISPSLTSPNRTDPFQAASPPPTTTVPFQAESPPTCPTSPSPFEPHALQAVSPVSRAVSPMSPDLRSPHPFRSVSPNSRPTSPPVPCHRVTTASPSPAPLNFSEIGAEGTSLAEAVVPQIESIHTVGAKPEDPAILEHAHVQYEADVQDPNASSLSLDPSSLFIDTAQALTVNRTNGLTMRAQCSACVLNGERPSTSAEVGFSGMCCGQSEGQVGRNEVSKEEATARVTLQQYLRRGEQDYGKHSHRYPCTEVPSTCPEAEDASTKNERLLSQYNDYREEGMSTLGDTGGFGVMPVVVSGGMEEHGIGGSCSAVSGAGMLCSVAQEETNDRIGGAAMKVSTVSAEDAVEVGKSLAQCEGCLGIAEVPAMEVDALGHVERGVNGTASSDDAGTTKQPSSVAVRVERLDVCATAAANSGRGAEDASRSCHGVGICCIPCSSPREVEGNEVCSISGSGRVLTRQDEQQCMSEQMQYAGGEKHQGLGFTLGDGRGIKMHERLIDGADALTQDDGTRRQGYQGPELGHLSTTGEDVSVRAMNTENGMLDCVTDESLREQQRQLRLPVVTSGSGGNEACKKLEETVDLTADTFPLQQQQQQQGSKVAAPSKQVGATRGRLKHNASSIAAEMVAVTVSRNSFPSRSRKQSDSDFMSVKDVGCQCGLSKEMEREMEKKKELGANTVAGRAAAAARRMKKKELGAKLIAGRAAAARRKAEAAARTEVTSMTAAASAAVTAVPAASNVATSLTAAARTKAAEATAADQAMKKPKRELEMLASTTGPADFPARARERIMPVPVQKSPEPALPVLMPLKREATIKEEEKQGSPKASGNKRRSLSRPPSRSRSRAAEETAAAKEEEEVKAEDAGEDEGGSDACDSVYTDKLQGQLIILSAAARAYRVLHPEKENNRLQSKKCADKRG